MLKYISVPVFLLSLIIGLFFIYILGPDLKTIYIYPTPETVDKILFRDKSENCFSFKEVSVTCPSDESQINQIPIQT
jgi:hypothetical protein